MGIPKISIIVSIYNSADYMRESLDSALNQTLKDIELVCVYRKGRDTTVDILRKYAQRDGRVKMFEQTDTIGCGPAKNQGIEQSTGEFITFLDADDYYSTNDCLEKLYNAAKENDVKVCGGLRGFLFKDGSTVGHPLHREACKGHPTGVLLQYIDYQFDYHFHSFLYDRNMIIENGFCFNDTLTYDDPHFFVRVMLYAKEFYVVPVEMYCYRLGAPYKWDYAQTRDSAIAFIDILRLSRDKRLAILHWKTVSRMNNGEYYNNFIRHLNGNDHELLNLLLQANALIDKELIDQVQENMPPRGVLDTQDVCMDKIECDSDGNYILKALQYIFEQNMRTDNENSESNISGLEWELKQELDGVRASVSYKAGRFITWLPRKIRSGMRCLRDHGFKYTTDLFFCKLRGKLKPKKTKPVELSRADVVSVSGAGVPSAPEETGDIKVSVVVPVFNVSKYLRECLDSIINQTLKEIEIICGDGGSNDGSLEILQEYAAKDSRIKIISKEGSGYGQSVNECMDMARGKYIGIVESDDVITPDAYENLYSIAELNQVDWIRADIYYYYAMNEEGKQLKKESIIYDGNFYNMVLNPQTDYRPYKSGLRTWSGIYNREFLNKYSIRHNETPGGSYQDVGFYLKTLYYAIRVYFTDNAFYLWRQDNPGSSIHYNSKKLVERSFNEWHLNKEYLDCHPELSSRAVASYHYRKFFSYLWTVEMADESDRPDVFKTAVKEFREAEWKKELDKGFFESWEWDKLQEMINQPKQFFAKKFSGKVKDKISFKRIIKRILKPFANLLRKITYKRMRDVIFRLERKIDDSAVWNRQQLEQVIAQSADDTRAAFHTEMEQIHEKSVKETDIKRIWEDIRTNAAQVRSEVQGDVLAIQENIRAETAQAYSGIQNDVTEMQENISASIQKMEDSMQAEIRKMNSRLLELEKTTTMNRAEDVSRKNKDTVSGLIELLDIGCAHNKKEIVEKNLRQIEIEVFSYCNRQCWFCPNRKINRHSENHSMPESMYLKILSELREIDFSGTITYSRYNEPLADKIILERVRQAREYCPNAFIRTNTNGDFLTREYLDALSSAGMNEMEIQCYFDENEEMSFGVFEERLKRTAEKLGIDGYDIVQYSETDRIKADFRYRKMHLSFFSLNMKRLANNRGEILNNTQSYLRTENCLIPFKYLYVDYNGSYMLCCNVRSDVEAHRKFILGNAETDSIFDIFTGEKITKFRKSLGTYGHKIPPCSSCSYVIMDDDIKLS